LHGLLAGHVPDGPNTIEIEDQDLWGAGVDTKTP
jgi:hypothetical protein